MIKLSEREIAQYLVADDADRLHLLRERKYMAADAVARNRFHARLRTSIWAYHRGSLGRDTIEARIATMREQATHAGPFQRSELLDHALMLERYLYYQGHRTLDLTPTLVTSLVRSDVEISVRPTLVAIEGKDTRRIIFLELRDRSSPAMMRIIAELAFEAFGPLLRGLPPRAIQVVDVRRGFLHELEQPGSTIGSDLSKACERISALWPHLAPPRAAQHSSRLLERPMSVAMDVER